MTNKYAVINNNIVVNTTISDDEFAQSQGWILCSENVAIGWSYINGEFVSPTIPTPASEQIQKQNKETATSLLQQTDWTCTVDIADPQYSNPYLTNQSTFLAFRSQVRAIAVNPPTTVAVFPEQPQAVWS